MAIQEAWNKRGHKVTVSSDGCWSMTHLRDAALDLGIDHWPIPLYSPRFNLAEQAIGNFKSTVTACLLGASADNGPIDASYVQYVAEYVTYMHELFVQKRRHHDKLLSPYELSDGVKPRLDRAVPFGTQCRLEYSRICFCSPRCAQGAGMEQIGQIRASTDVGLPKYVLQNLQMLNWARVNHSRGQGPLVSAGAAGSVPEVAQGSEHRRKTSSVARSVRHKH